MSTAWTVEQKKVIDLRNRNILVSAAAGSGKTAVLVERIIRRITDETSPVDVDRMLIVTFTEAAASEMKERIGAAIEKQLEKRPGDARLEQQAALIHTAPITTIHSFCLSVIREHFHVIGIDPGFRIVEEGELKLLKQDVLDELLEEKYEEAEESFFAFVKGCALIAAGFIVTVLVVMLALGFAEIEEKGYADYDGIRSLVYIPAIVLGSVVALGLIASYIASLFSRKTFKITLITAASVAGAALVALLICLIVYLNSGNAEINNGAEITSTENALLYVCAAGLIVVIALLAFLFGKGKRKL